MVQDKMQELFQRTVDGLPTGARVTTTIPDVAVTFAPCDDQQSGPSIRVICSDERWLKIPGGMPNADLHDAIEGIWRDAGWHVGRNDPRLMQPNVTAATDGYLLVLSVGGRHGDEPTVGVSSPCYLRANSSYTEPYQNPIVHS